MSRFAPTPSKFASISTANQPAATRPITVPASSATKVVGHNSSAGLNNSLSGLNSNFNANNAPPEAYAALPAAKPLPAAPTQTKALPPAKTPLSQQEVNESYPFGNMLQPQRYTPTKKSNEPVMPDGCYFCYKFMHDELGCVVKTGALCMCSSLDTAEEAVVRYAVSDMNNLMSTLGVARDTLQEYRALLTRQLTAAEQEDFVLTSDMVLRDNLIYTSASAVANAPGVILVKDVDSDYAENLWIESFQGPSQLKYDARLTKSFVCPLNEPAVYHVMVRNEADLYDPVFTYYTDYTELYVFESVKKPSQYDDLFDDH